MFVQIDKLGNTTIVGTWEKSIRKLYREFFEKRSKISDEEVVVYPTASCCLLNSLAPIGFYKFVSSSTPGSSISLFTSTSRLIPVLQVFFTL